MKTFNTAGDAKDYSRNNPLETVEYKDYHYNGQLWEHCFYVNGEFHGEYKSYYDDGQLDERCFFVNGELHGEYKWYFSNGRLMYHRFFVNGKPHGEYKKYLDNGKLNEHRFFVNGDNIYLDYLRDGSYKSKCILSTLFNGNLIDEDI